MATMSSPSPSSSDSAAATPPVALPLMAAALDAMPGEVAVLDGQGIVVAANRAWRRARGAEDDDETAGIGRRYFDLYPAGTEIEDGGAPSVRARLSALLTGGPAFDAVFPCHLFDRPRWCRLSAAPLELPYRGAVVIHADVSTQIESELKLHQLANYDELTGVMRRRRFMERLDDAFRSARRYGHPLALAIGDLDDLKPINDAHGHAGGDRCLAAFASVLTGAVRATDSVGRYGGDEFVVAFPHTRAQDAVSCLERVRKNLAQRVRALGLPPFTATFGVVELDASYADVAQFVGAADAALYRGKSAGRDRVEIAPAVKAASAET